MVKKTEEAYAHVNITKKTSIYLSEHTVEQAIKSYLIRNSRTLKIEDIKVDQLSFEWGQHAGDVTVEYETQGEKVSIDK